MYFRTTPSCEPLRRAPVPPRRTLYPMASGGGPPSSLWALSAYLTHQPERFLSLFCRQSQSAALWACCPRVPAQRWAVCPFLSTRLPHLTHPATAPAPLVPGLRRGGPLPHAPGVRRAALPAPDNVSPMLTVCPRESPWCPCARPSACPHATGGAPGLWAVSRAHRSGTAYAQDHKKESASHNRRCETHSGT